VVREVGSRSTSQATGSRGRMLSSERSTSNSVTLQQFFQQLNLVCRQLLIAAYSMISSAPPRKHGKLYFILQLGATRTSSHRKLVFIFEKRCAPIHCRSRSCYLRAVFIAENSVRPHFEQAAQVIPALQFHTPALVCSAPHQPSPSVAR
jgi:hypothetical protein